MPEAKLTAALRWMNGIFKYFFLIASYLRDGFLQTISLPDIFPQMRSKESKRNIEPSTEINYMPKFPQIFPFKIWGKCRLPTRRVIRITDEVTSPAGVNVDLSILHAVRLEFVNK